MDLPAHSRIVFLILYLVGSLIKINNEHSRFEQEYVRLLEERKFLAASIGIKRSDSDNLYMSQKFTKFAKN